MILFLNLYILLKKYESMAKFILYTLKKYKSMAKFIL